MRRRLTIAMVVMVAAALTLAGVVTLLVGVHAARVDERRELTREATGLAVTLQTEAVTARPRNPAAPLRKIIRALRAPLRLEGAAVVGIRPTGALFDPGNPARKPRLPSGLVRADLDLASLRALQPVSGATNGLLYAAAPYQARAGVGLVERRPVQVVVLTRRPPTGLSAAGPWFLGAAAVIIVAAVLIADRLGRRFVRPLQAVEATTGSIAAGDLEARVPQPAGLDPELNSLAASVNTMAGALARARMAEHQFLLSVSHDLRTPLTSIRGFAEAIEDGVTTETVAAARIIGAEARRLERLVGDLLDLAKLQARQFSLEVAPLDLAEVVASTAGGFGPEASELGIGIDIGAARGAPLPALADPDRLSQVVANLVENALSFARTTVWVGAGLLEGVPVLWVDDDGPGIPGNDLPRIFERLYSDRPRSARRIGSGLGLAIVAELAGAMGGSVRAESPLFAWGGGTRMVVALQSPA